MSKPSISYQNTRLSPNSSFNRSAQQSRGEILLSDVFNLPLIANSGSHRNSAHSTIAQTTISNQNGFSRRNSRMENNNGQKMGFHRLTSREQVYEHEINQDLIESYYIQKNLRYEREQIISRRSRISNEEQPQVKRVRRPSLQITNSRCQVQKVQVLSKQLRQDIDYQVSEEMTNQTTESLKHLQEKFNRVNKYQQKSQTNNIVFYDIEQSLDNQAKSFLIRKMKGVFKCVYSAIVIAKQCRINKKLLEEQLDKQNEKFQESQKEIRFYSKRQILAQNKEFVKGLTNKIFHFMKTPNYINQCIIQGTQLGNDQRKTSIANFSKFFLQNLEFFTRESQLPKLFKSQIIASLWKNSEQQTSYFVGKRCHFFEQTKKSQISREQKNAIAMENLLFEIIIPQLLKLVEDIPSLSINYKSETQNNMIGIASLLQKLFVQRFKSLEKIKNPNGNMINKELIVQILANDNIKTEIIQNNSMSDNNIVLKGLMNFSVLEMLEEERPNWKNQIEAIFDKIIQNIEKMLNF